MNAPTTKPSDRPYDRPSREERSDYWAAGGQAIHAALQAWVFFGSWGLARLAGSWGSLMGVLVVGFSLACGAYQLRRARRMTRTRRRLAGGQCLACGYDLRESPERCPECGRESREPTPRP